MQKRKVSQHCLKKSKKKAFVPPSASCLLLSQEGPGGHGSNTKEDALYNMVKWAADFKCGKKRDNCVKDDAILFLNFHLSKT